MTQSVETSSSQDDLSEDELRALIAEHEGRAPSPATLKGWRSTGEGPRFYKRGAKAFYPRCEVLAWLTSRRTPVVASLRELRHRRLAARCA